MSESERVQLARSLHDGIAQELVALSYRIQLIGMRSDLTPELAAEMRALQSSIAELSRSIRDELLELRSPTVTDITETLNQLAAASLFPGQLTITISVDSMPRLASDALIELTRNALSHARASRIDISAALSEGVLHISIQDDGIGGAEVKDGHFGISGVRENIASLGGKFQIEFNNGTHAWIEIPLT
jgi:signal transduction histidine kinase